ncbi:hypothetical protein CIB95_05340 [Lottiidibacillus patelloidae]|uniref:Uncharacterized protein n=1 Tax=Lottiidibacillus patelloidae TaxID=2670334 RepID=A0A263BVL1_9BACI|nr:hypothetical protein [Lottiidibacillus patelloidae]OZM57791.1 hypothetical protein CIB95_05340 [Lottiidibacillus patelloidae]
MFGIFSFIAIAIPLIIVLVALFIMQRYLQVIALRKVFIFYLLLLLLSAAFVHILPKDNFISLEDIRISEPHSADFNAFYQAIHSDTLKDHEQFIIKKTWDFTSHDGEIEIIYPESSSPIFVERRESDNNAIEVVHYTSKFSFGSTDLTEKKNTFTITFHDNKLMITDPEKFDYEIAGFKKDFVVIQFNEGSLYSGDYFIPMNSRSFDAIVIRIPKGLKLTPNSKYQLVNQ